MSKYYKEIVGEFFNPINFNFKVSDVSKNTFSITIDDYLSVEYDKVFMEKLLNGRVINGNIINSLHLQSCSYSEYEFMKIHILKRLWNDYQQTISNDDDNLNLLSLIYGIRKLLVIESLNIGNCFNYSFNLLLKNYEDTEYTEYTEYTEDTEDTEYTEDEYTEYEYTEDEYTEDEY